MISFLVPTRGRPEMLLNFVTSVLLTAAKPNGIEFIVRLDNDDPSYDSWEFLPQVKIEYGERKNLAQLYEWERASGEILVMGADDVVFHTKGWDTKVLAEFEKVPDKILLVYGDDGNPNNATANATMPFIHKNWIKAVGRYLPPYFSGDFIDTWLTALADGVGRKVKIDIYTEHLHPAFGKREQDQVDKDKWEKHFSGNMPQKYLDTEPERLEEIEKLKKFIEEFK